MRMLTALAILIFSCGAHAESIRGRVIGIIDGDTLDLLSNGYVMRIRIQGIDTPERGEPFATVAKKVLAELVHGKEVRAHLAGIVTHGRQVAEVFHDDTNIGREIVVRGLGWHCRNYLASPSHRHAEEKARRERLGIHGVATLSRKTWCVGP